MKIRCGRGFDPAFHEALKTAVVAAHDILIRAELATPQIRQYLNNVVIKPSNRMIGSAGIAHYRTQSISLNARLLKTHPEALLRTLVHEVCHLIDYERNGGRGHGASWRELMVKCGYQPERCHTMDVSTLRKAAHRLPGVSAISCEVKSPQRKIV